MTHRERGLVAVVIVLGGAIWWLLRHPSVSAVPKTSNPAPATATSQPDHAAHSAAPASGQTNDAIAPVPSISVRPTFSVPMPDRSQPLAVQIPALRTRAEEGDPVAACALALDVQWCVAAEAAATAHSGIERSMLGGRVMPVSDLTIEMIAQMRESVADAETYCRGLGKAELPTPDAAVHAALDRMTVRQRVLLALATHDGRIARFPRKFAPPQSIGQGEYYVLPQYVSDHGYEFLMQGYEAADPLALEGLLLVHLPVWNPAVRWSPALSMPNARLFVTYTMMLREIIGAEALGDTADTVLWRVRATMSSEALQRIDADVQQRLARWRRVAALRPAPDSDVDPRTACSN